MECCKWSNVIRLFRTIFITALFTLFLQQSITAVIKFLDGKTSYHITLKVLSTNHLPVNLLFKNNVQERTSLVYPSVTVCKKYTFNEYIDDIFLNKSLSLEEVVETATAQSWDVEELFYFFSQPNRRRARFPCTTVYGGTRPGQPCVFPVFNTSGHRVTQCYKMGTPDPGCFTKAGPGNR